MLLAAGLVGGGVGADPGGEGCPTKKEGGACGRRGAPLLRPDDERAERDQRQRNQDDEPRAVAVPGIHTSGVYGGPIRPIRRTSSRSGGRPVASTSGAGRLPTIRGAGSGRRRRQKLKSMSTGGAPGGRRGHRRDDGAPETRDPRRASDLRTPALVVLAVAALLEGYASLGTIDAATFVVRPGGAALFGLGCLALAMRADPAVVRRPAHLRRTLPAVRLGAARRDRAGHRHRHPGTRPRSGGCFRPARRHHRVDRRGSRRAPERPSPTRGGPSLQGPEGDGRLGEPSARRGRGPASLRPFVPLSRARGRVVRPVGMRGATAVDSSRVTHLLSTQ